MFRFVVLAALLATASAFQPRLDGRIVGGENAYIGDYPHQLSLQVFDSHICGASIIAGRWAVTAAHCTDGQNAAYMTVVAGVSNLKENGQTLRVTRIHQHPGFSMNNLNQDISLLELGANFHDTDKIRAIRLVDDGFDPASGSDVVVTGWGALYTGGYVSDDLQKVTVQIVDRAECRAANGNLVTDYMICAGVPGGGKDACQGDSGGPLVAGGKLVGIVSWGWGCAEPRLPGVYANVGALRSYIKEISGV